MAYCRQVFIVVNIEMALQPQHRGFVQVMFEKHLELILGKSNRSLNDQKQFINFRDEKKSFLLVSELIIQE